MFIEHYADRMTDPERYAEQENIMDLKVPEKIVNVYTFDDKPPIYLVQWKAVNGYQYIAAPVCMKKCPELVEEFEKNYLP